MALLRKFFVFCALTFLMISCVQLNLPVRAIATHTMDVRYYQVYIYNDHDPLGPGEWHFRLGAAGQPWTDYYEKPVDGPGYVDVWFVNKYIPISSSTEFYCEAREEDGLPGATYWGYTSKLTVIVPYPWPTVNMWHYGDYKLGDVRHFYRYRIENLAPTVSAISGPSAGSPSLPYTYSTTGSDPEGDGLTFEWSINGTIVPGATGSSLVYTFPVVGTYTVRVRAKDSLGTFSGYTSKNVTITTPGAGTLTVTSPNGGESWVRGTTHPITWTWTGSVGANVKIELLKSGVVKGTITTANDGSYSWTIGTSNLGTDYKIRITSISNPAITDSSDSNFAITADGAGTLTVTSPNGGESWVRGTTHPITWTWTGSVGANVKIELLKSGVVKGTITTANDGSYSWTIGTSHLGSDYKIRITSTTNPAITDSSDSDFTITT